MKIQKIFKDGPAILPVIHVESETQALRNVKRAQLAGTDGVFLINHNISARDLTEIYRKVRSEYSDWWIGLNFLGSSVSVFEMVPMDANGLWVDNAGVDERISRQTEAHKNFQFLKDRGWKGLYFGGVAFKYQREVEDVESAAKIAVDYMDVVTTSGPGTGFEADLGKIKRMRGAMGSDSLLAVASGLTYKNVKFYLPYVDCLMVATGISVSHEELDFEKTKKFVEIVRKFQKEEQRLWT